MSRHSFLKESKLYIVYGGNKYRIYTSTALSFSQTFTQDSYPVKTLHNQSKMFEGANITKANPVDFSFDVPLTIEKDESSIITLLQNLTNTQLTSFDMYVQTGSAVFKVTSALVTTGSFDINPNNQFTVKVQGQGTKLERVGFGDDSYYMNSDSPPVRTQNTPYSIPGNLIAESETRTPLLVYPVVSIDSLTMGNIMSTTLQIQNMINWTEFGTLQESLNVTNSSNIMRPTTYTVDKRTVSGAVKQYQTDNNNTQFDNFSTNSNITIKAIQVGKAADATPFFQMSLNPASFTSRIETSDVFTQSYDYRLLDNANSVADIITQYS